MKKEAFSLLTILRNIVCVILALLVMLSAPTGWLYDLWAGEGMGQGQRPGADVQQLRQQEDIETCFLSSTPATVNGGDLAACPLARLRDTGQAGVHTRNNSGVKRTVSVSEYIYADYPLSPLQRFVQGFVGGYYNRYYLAELEDGSWLCVYFDDYLVLMGADNYPTGYVQAWESKLDAGCSASACCMRGRSRECVGYQKGSFKMFTPYPWRVSQKCRRGGAGYGGQFCLGLFGPLGQNAPNLIIY